jgi:hypothetical protein
MRQRGIVVGSSCRGVSVSGARSSPHRLMRAALIAVERLLRGEFVLVDQAAESVAPADATLVVVRGDGNRLEKRRSLLERAVRAMRVVVRDVLAQHPLQVLARDN